MENREKKRILDSYQHYLIEERTIAEAIEINYSRYLTQSPKYDGMPHSPGGKDLAEYVARQEELVEKLHRTTIKKYETLLEITQEIDKMPVAVERSLLKLRYIKGLPFEEVAINLPRKKGGHYSYRQTVRLHGAALAHFMEGGKDERQ